MILKWERSRNDLHTSFNCTCPSKRWEGTEIAHLMTTKIDLSGYFDSNYFDNVNAKPRQFKCQCGKQYTQQWFPNGTVEVKEVQ